MKAKTWVIVGGIASFVVAFIITAPNEFINQPLSLAISGSIGNISPGFLLGLIIGGTLKMFDKKRDFWYLVFLVSLITNVFLIYVMMTQ